MPHEHTITVRLSDAAEQGLVLRAGSDAATVSQFVETLLERELSGAAKTFDQIAAPFRQAFAASQTSEDEFARIVDEARAEVWANKSGIGS